MRFPLFAEILAARAAGGLSRFTGRGGGTTVPGKLLWKVDPGAIDRLAARLPAGSAIVSATNGKTTTAAMAAEILRPGFRLAHNGSGANLVSGVASTLLAARDAELGLFEVDEAALSGRRRARAEGAVCPGNLFRDQLDRYGELELVAARWRDAVASLPEAQLVVNGDDPQVGDLGRDRNSGARSSGWTTRARHGRRCNTPRTRSTASGAALRTSTPRRTSATSATTAVRPAVTRARRSTSSRARSSSPVWSTRRSRS